MRAVSKRQQDPYLFEKPVLELEEKIKELEALAKAKSLNIGGEIATLRERLQALLRETFERISPYDRVMVARHPNRPQIQDYLEMIVQEFVELHGDRAFGDDKAMVTGFGRIDNHRVLIVGQRKGKSTKEKIANNFGSAHPEGYRKALLKMRMAEKFGLPIVSFIDTPGAYPGVGAEERGVAYTIAVNLLEMARLRVPVLCVVLGEGGSGGALGIGVGDRIGMLENAYYSVITPEGCAAILWRDAASAADAAKALRCTAKELKTLGVIDDIIPEPLGGAHRNPEEAGRNLKSWMLRTLEDFSTIPIAKIVEDRQERFRAIGTYLEGGRLIGTRLDPPDIQTVDVDAG